MKEIRTIVFTKKDIDNFDKGYDGAEELFNEVINLLNSGYKDDRLSRIADRLSDILDMFVDIHNDMDEFGTAEDEEDE